MNRNGLVISVLILWLVLLVGCVPKGPAEQSEVYVSFFNETEEEEPTLIVIEEPEIVEEPEIIEEPKEVPKEEPEKVELEELPDNIPVRTYKEGDLIELKVSAVDPDDDVLEITYSSPLDEEGAWQTDIGDAGQYKVVITVSDGKVSTSQEVLIIVQPRNKPPVIEIEDEITINEGETLMLEPIVSDPDGDTVTVSYSGWIETNTYTAGYDETGSYIVTVIASDGLNSVAKDVKINVLNVNRPPVLSGFQPLSIVEGDQVEITPVVMDPDKEELEISFSEPLDNEGKWQTEPGDAGTYEVVVTASDGIASVSESLKISVSPLNRAPVIQRIKAITVEEGETIEFEPVIIDPDGDTFTVSYSGWMNGPSYTTTYNDQGSHMVSITATDSKGASASQGVAITVEDVNRPPEIILE